MNRKAGFISLLVSSILFSTYGIFSRLLAQQFTVFQQLSFRYLIGIAIVLFIVYLLQHKSINFKKFLNLKIAVFALIIPFSFYFFIRAFVESKLSVSISGFYAGTILSSLFIGLLFLKEKLSVYGALGLILILFSFLFLNNLDMRGIVTIGLVWGLFSGVLYGVESYIKKDAGTFTKEEILLVISVSTAVIMFLFSFLNKETLPTALSGATFLTLSLFVSAALSAEYLTVLGFRNFDLYLGSIVMSLEIVFTIFVGMIFFGEVPTAAEFIGASLIILSVVITNLPKTTQSA